MKPFDAFDFTRLFMKTHHRTAYTFNILFLCGLLLDAYKIHGLGFLICWYIGSVLNTFKNEETARVYYFMCLMMDIFSQLKMFSAFGCLLIAYNQGSMQPEFRSAVRVFITIFAKFLNPLQLLRYDKVFLQQLSYYYDRILGPLKFENRMTAIKIKAIEISDEPIICSEWPHTPPNRVRHKLWERMRQTWLINMLLSLAIFILSPGYDTSCVAMFLALFCHHVIDVTEAKRIVNRSAPLIEDGLYRIYWNYLPLWNGVGTSVNGILHVPYQVCHGAGIMHEGTLVLPSFISAYRDLVTYGGPPAFARVKKDDALFVNCEQTEATYKINYELDSGTGDFTWSAVTNTIVSGTPIFLKEEGKLLLVGLAGSYIRERNGSVTEFVLGSPKIKDEGIYKKIITHPGSGKTREIVPCIIREHLAREDGKKILVTGPIGLTCTELYNKFHGTHSLGLNVESEEAHTDPFALVQIATHACAIKMLINDDETVQNLGCLVIDEAHVKDSRTIMLRQFGIHLLVSGIRLVELSATLDGDNDSNSNFFIEDFKINGDIRSHLELALAEGNRVLVFVPGIESNNGTDLQRRFYKYNPILLSRKTLNEAMKSLPNLDRRLIISTDIAECGINIPDLDVVIDLCQIFGKHYENGKSIGKTYATINEASRIQRKGRVGRTKAGRYMYCSDPEEQTLMTAAEFEAQVLMTGRSWSPEITNTSGIELTDEQFKEWINGKKDLAIYNRSFQN